MWSLMTSVQAYHNHIILYFTHCACRHVDIHDLHNRKRTEHSCYRHQTSPRYRKPLVVVGSAFHASPYGPLRPNVTSFIKPEIEKRIATPPEEDRATVTGDQHKKFREDRSSGSGDMLADRQTDTQTDTLIAILRSATGAE